MASPPKRLGLPWRYAIGCIDNLDLILRAEVIWSKPTGSPNRSPTACVGAMNSGSCSRRNPLLRGRRRDSGTIAPGTAERLRRATAFGRLTPRAVEGELHAADGGPTSTNPLGPGLRLDDPHPNPSKVPDWLGVDHFAAYPQEWPRRIILGWSPSGICRTGTAASGGEGVRRRPRVGGRSPNNDDNNAKVTARMPVGGRRATITGYACDCPTPPHHPPAVVLDPFGHRHHRNGRPRLLGRYPVPTSQPIT